MFSPLQLLLMAFVSFSGITVLGSVKIIREGEQALVETFGKYNGKTLQPGLTFLTPLVEQAVYKQTMREQILNLPPVECLTSDRLSVSVDFAVYWRIIDLEKVAYKVQDLYEALDNLLHIEIRSQLVKCDSECLYTSRDEINEALVQQLDIATEPWGIKITRVLLRDFTINSHSICRKNAQNSKYAMAKSKATDS
ncbi:MAG: SPFH domain-containing protein [Cyanobacteriota bacterium]|nr:SPFH domain-containing protein [Cyanobacteriota bacterium]